MKTKIYILVFILLLISLNNYSQNFIFSLGSTNPNLPAASNGWAAWGDYDNDDSLDIIVTPSSKIYKQSGESNVIEQTGITILPCQKACWGDLDNDGDLDLLLNNPMKIYRNNGNNSFTLLLQLPGTSSGSISWGCTAELGDYDNDGDLDVFLKDGYHPNSYIVYKNDGNFSFSEQTGILLTGTNLGLADLGDYNNDGFLDIIIPGMPVTKIFKNNGDNSFTEQTGISIVGVGFGSTNWGDYDNDGYLDFIITGSVNGTLAQGNFISKIYKNNGDNSFTEQSGISLSGGAIGSAAWGDYNNDGNIDLLYTGKNNAGNPSILLYTNNGNNTFTQLPAGSGGTFGFQGVTNGSAVWGDYNNDGKIDILSTGRYENQNVVYYITNRYKNYTAIANTSPSIPANLQWDPLKNSLSWNSSIDQETPSKGLTYNVAIGTASNPSIMMTSNSNLKNGFRRIPAKGNTKDTILLYKNFGNFDSIYYARVQAIDNGYKGSAFSDSLMFQISPKGLILIDTSLNCGLPAQLNVNIINGDSSNLTYQWSPINGLSNPNIQNPIAIPNITTTYKVTVTANSGLFLIDSVTVTVLSVGDIIGDTTVCQGQNSVTYSVPSNLNATSYIWTLPNGSMLNSNNNQITISYGPNALSGNIKVKPVYSCGTSDSSYLFITVNPSVPTPVITQSGGTLSSNATSGNQWYNNSTGIINGATSQTFSPSQSGVYYVIVSNGTCSSLKSNYINFTYGTSISEFNEIGMNVYPNPATNQLQIRIDQKLIGSAFSITDFLGRKVITGKLTAENTVVEIGNLSNGIYLLRIGENGQQTFKVVKE